MRIGGTGRPRPDGAGEQRPDRGPQLAHGGVQRLVRDGRVLRAVQQRGPLTHPDREPLRTGQVIGDAAVPVVAQGDGEFECEPCCGHEANGNVTANH